jgi:hypothetical protein
VSGWLIIRGYLLKLVSFFGCRLWLRGILLPFSQ